MAEPTATVTLAASGVAMPALVVFGVSLGLRPDVLLAGFSGAIAAIALLNTVPTSGDTLAELLRTSLRRVGVAVASAFVAAYTAPLLLLVHGVPDALLLSMAFVAGVWAPQALRKLGERFMGKASPPTPAGPDQGGQA